MTMTVADILEVPHLGTTVHAGSAGLGNEVRWAHVCDMADPAEWLGPGDLLLSTGRGIPVGAAEQVGWVERLSGAGIAGMAVSADMHAPVIDAAMVAAAERCAFPVLLTAFEVPFVALTRAVAAANQELLREGAERTQLLYNAVLRSTVAGATKGRLLQTLGRIVGCDLYVVDGETAEPLAVYPSPPPELATVLRERAAGGSLTVPSIFRLTWGARPVVGMAIPTTRPALLVGAGAKQARLESSVLVHVSTILALELERLWTERDRRRRSGAELLISLMDGALALDAAAPQLREHELDADRLRLLACTTIDGRAPSHEEGLHHRLANRRIPHLLALRDDVLLALLVADDDHLAAFRAELDPDAAIGASDTFDGLGHAPDAVHEAQLALQSAHHAAGRLATYGEGSSLVPFLPATLSEARRVATVVLGTLARYDEANGTQLLPSLRAFLVHNRSWTRAAAALHVHKQTLVYRMRRVEELTGRRLDRTQDVVELWLALRAHDLAGYS